MKPLKLNSFYKFICFVLLVILIVSAVGFAADGWQIPNTPDSGEIGNKTDDTDENKDGQVPSEDNNNEGENNQSDKNDTDNNTEQPPIIPEEPEVIYTSTITGLEITEEEFNTLPIGVIVNPSAPLYGISDADVAIEFPIEDGTTRLLSYSTSSDVLWKIGALSATRNYITGTAGFFGGIVVCYGNDDKVVYNAWETGKLELDLSRYASTYYTENTLYIYTSESMINSALNREPDLSYTASGYKDAPYDFISNTAFVGTTVANTVIIPFSSENESAFYYHENTGKYLFYKSGNRKIDMLNGKNISYTNLFLLFADAVTYEKADGTELVIDTISGGAGYYISKGMLTEFRWSTDKSGALHFSALNGEKLTVNRGNAYMAFFKASNSAEVKAY